MTAHWRRVAWLAVALAVVEGCAQAVVGGTADADISAVDATDVAPPDSSVPADEAAGTSDDSFDCASWCNPVGGVCCLPGYVIDCLRLGQGACMRPVVCVDPSNCRDGGVVR